MFNRKFQFWRIVSRKKCFKAWPFKNWEAKKEKNGWLFIAMYMFNSAYNHQDLWKIKRYLKKPQSTFLPFSFALIVTESQSFWNKTPVSPFKAEKYSLIKCKNTMLEAAIAKKGRSYADRKSYQNLANKILQNKAYPATDKWKVNGQTSSKSNQSNNFKTSMMKVTIKIIFAGN